MRKAKISALLFASCLFSSPVYAAGSPDLKHFIDNGRVPPGIAMQIDQSGEAEIIVTLDDSDVQAKAAEMRNNLGVRNDNAAILSEKARLYGEKKASLLAGIPDQSYSLLKDYDNLPVMFMRVNSQALTAILNRKEVKSVAENRAFVPFLTESLPLIHQPEAEATGATGAGTFVAVVDTGVYYTNGYFGTCTGGPGSTGCEVAFEQCFATGGCLSDKNHGTNVSGIVLGVAPATKVLALDVFRTSGLAYDNDILAALNWVLAEQGNTSSPYYGRIDAVNMSLGGGQYIAQCPGDNLASPITNLKNAGVTTAVASGNSGYTNSLSSPACVPDAVSVGAVYDSYVGSKSWCTDSSCSSILCTDNPTAADQVTCFSNSASFLTMLAPGSVITAAGISMSGTSQATPFVSGAVAAIKGQYDTLTVAQVVASMTGAGPLITDPKSNVTKPRLDLYDALLAAGPDIGIAPSSHDFGYVTQGSSSAPQTFTVTNSGTADLKLGTLTFTGVSASDFLKQNDNCSGQTVTTSNNCTVQVTFSPQSAGAKAASLSVPSNDPVNPALTVSLSGTGVTLLTADFSATPLSGAVPLYVSFTDLSTGSPASWLWTFGDGDSSTEQNPSHNFKTPVTGTVTYTISLTVANSGGSNTITKTDYITVNACATDPAMVSSVGYPTLQSAYNAVTNGGTVQLQAVDFGENVTLDQAQGVNFTLEGGYNCDYGSNQAYSTIAGSLTVTSGTITIDRIIIQ